MPEITNTKSREAPPPIRSAASSPYAFAELDAVTNFSFLRGASHPDEIVYRAAELGYRAIGVTDHQTLAGIVRAHDAAKQAGIKLVIGTRLKPEDGPDLLVWPTDRRAYARLCRLLTLGKRRAEKGECALRVEDVAEHAEGMIGAIDVMSEDSGGREKDSSNKNSVLSRKGRSPATPSRDFLSERKNRGGAAGLRLAREDASWSSLPLLRSSFGSRLSLALSVVHAGDDEGHLRRMLELSRSLGIPPLATNHAHYHDPSRRPLQDVLTCIRHGCTIHEAGFKLLPNAERHLKSPEHVHRLFDLCPEAIRRTIEVADQCNFSLSELRYEYPDEIVPPGKTSIEHLADLTWKGAAGRYPVGIPEKVRQQIAHELALIEKLKIEAYFLTVYDLVTFARSRGILCQGRGSAANSAVCYCLGVTSVDPARIDVLFERFVSSARNEPPDIDIDFEHERREEVIQYVYEKYGRERSGMTAEVITYRGRSAVRDVGKALGLSLDMVDAMAKKLDWWTRGVLTDEQIRESGLDPADRTICLVVGLTAQLLGFPRHLSQHVGGMVMTRGPLCELVPIENASMEGRTVIEWDKDDIDAVGILKVDCLGLGMLTCISRAFQFINGEGVSKGLRDKGIEELDEKDDDAFALGPLARQSLSPSFQQPLELHTIPPEDLAVYEMISDADTIGVFQIESRAQMSMLPRLRPKCFYDLVIEVAIVRPGPIQGDMVHPYLRRRNGDEPVSYPSKALEAVLSKTLGVPLFQEQAMKVAMVGAGFSAEEADQLRRAMAAWRKTGALETFHPKIIKGMIANGYTLEFAEQCFHQIRGFGEYGFPESHSASFALLVYASSWIKRYHPAAFCAALLNSQPMGFYAPAQIVRDAREHGVTVLPADVNVSGWDCELEGLEKGQRDKGTKGLREEEQAHCSSPQSLSPSVPLSLSSPKHTWGLHGPAVRLGFRVIKGFRLDQAERIVAERQRNGRFTSVADFHRRTGLAVSVLRRVAEADAFASLGLSRRQALWEVMGLHNGQIPLFNDIHTEQHEPAPELPRMPLGQEVMIDYAQTGLSLKKHPVALVREKLRAMKVITAAELRDVAGGRWVRVAGLVLIRQRPGTAKGIIFETLEDETGSVNLIVRPHVYERYRPAARHAGLLLCDGPVERQGQVIHIMAARLVDLSHLLAGYELRSRDFH